MPLPDPRYGGDKPTAALKNRHGGLKLQSQHRRHRQNTARAVSLNSFRPRASAQDLGLTPRRGRKPRAAGPQGVPGDENGFQTLPNRLFRAARPPARYGSVNEHNALVSRDWCLEPWEKAAILDFHAGHPLEGYRRLAFMMLDADVVAVSPSSVYRVLRDAGLLKHHNSKPSLKGKGFQQPLHVHEHRHVDVSYINVAGTFFYLCSLLDGCSRYIVHWEIRESMTEPEIETIIQ